jgi:hypothetical protein
MILFLSLFRYIIQWSCRSCCQRWTVEIHTFICYMCLFVYICVCVIHTHTHTHTQTYTHNNTMCAPSHLDVCKTEKPLRKAQFTRCPLLMYHNLLHTCIQHIYINIYAVRRKQLCTCSSNSSSNNTCIARFLLPLAS